MTKRLTYEEKGKGLRKDQAEENILRVKVSSFNNSALKEKHALTLIGRVTNPRQQRVWALISFLSKIWDTSSRAIGADLGNGLFQFQFANEEDMQSVLRNRPYHFGKWMVILQKWEESTDPAFPALIPFWIKVQGLPVHLWCKEILESIGNSMGNLEKVDITATTARIRVGVNGLKPLVMRSVVEFADGSEVNVQLQYEKLMNHCYHCKRLDHDIKSCAFGAPKIAEEIYPTEGKAKEKSDNRRNGIPKDQHQGATSMVTKRLRNHEDNSPERFNKSRRIEYIRRGSRTSENRVQSQSQNSNMVWRKVDKRDYQEKGSENILMTEPNLADQVSTPVPIQQSSPQKNIPNEALKEARLQLQEYMLQYVNVADPTESAARRSRLQKAEESGKLERNAEKLALTLIQSPVNRSSPILAEEGMEENRASPFKSVEDQSKSHDNVERVSALQRIGTGYTYQEEQSNISPFLRLGSKNMVRERGEVHSANHNTELYQMEQAGTRVEDPPAPPKKKPSSKSATQPAALRKIAISPTFLRGMGSRKRKTVQAKPSPKRKLSMDKHRKIDSPVTAGNRQNIPKSTAGPSNSGAARPQTVIAPNIKIIPAMEKKKLDFQNPVIPLP